METITRSAYGSLLQTCQFMGLPFTVLANTTLNEKFNVQAGVLPPAGVYPYLRYFTIGNGGHTMTIGADNVPAPEPQQHTARNAALFKHLPFVLREQTNDLSPSERAKYGLRREETWNGVRYYAYYLKRLDVTNIVPGLEYVVVDGDTTTTTDFIPDSSDLNPVPQQLSPSGVNVVSGDYLSATARVPLSLSENDMSEFLNVAMVMFGDTKYAIISEIAMCTGVDKQVASPGPGGSTIQQLEAIAVQCAAYVETFIPAKFLPSGTDIVLDLGATEPLFLLQDPNNGLIVSPP